MVLTRCLFLLWKLPEDRRHGTTTHSPKSLESVPFQNQVLIESSLAALIGCLYIPSTIPMRDPPTTTCQAGRAPPEPNSGPFQMTKNGPFGAAASGPFLPALTGGRHSELFQHFTPGFEPSVLCDRTVWKTSECLRGHSL